MAQLSAQYTLPFSAIGLADIARVGGKNASLGELLCSLTPLGVRVPDGFAVTAAAFSAHLRAAELEEQIFPALERLDVRDVAALAREGQRIRELIRSAPLPAAISEQVRAAYRDLSRHSPWRAGRCASSSILQERKKS